MYKTLDDLLNMKLPRISQGEFMSYYNIDEAEIQKYELQEFLDFFEVSKKDLYMESKEEVFLMLQGFRFDRRAERTFGEAAEKETGEAIRRVEFTYTSEGLRVSGMVDFEEQYLYFEDERYRFLEADGSVLCQALMDLEVMNKDSNNEEMELRAEGSENVCEFVIWQRNERKKGLAVRECDGEMFFQIVGAIMEWRK